MWRGLLANYKYITEFLKSVFTKNVRERNKAGHGSTYCYKPDDLSQVKLDEEFLCQVLRSVDVAILIGCLPLPDSIFAYKARMALLHFSYCSLEVTSPNMFVELINQSGKGFEDDEVEQKSIPRVMCKRAS